MASARIQRWALTLSAYRYTIRYKAGAQLSNADALSRLPRPQTITSDRLPGELVNLIKHLTIDSANIKHWTGKDPILSRMRQYLRQGWPTDLEDHFKPYKFRQNGLSLLNDCVLWGTTEDCIG